MTDNESIDEVTRLLDPIEDETWSCIRDHVPEGEELLIRVFADLDLDGRYTTQWVVATPERVLVVSGPHLDDLTEVPVAELTRVGAEALVSGGNLELECRDQPLVRVPYTSSLVAKFSEVARGLEQLRRCLSRHA